MPCSPSFATINRLVKLEVIVKNPEDQSLTSPCDFLTATHSLPPLVAARVQASLCSLFSNNSDILFFLTCFCNNICYHFSYSVSGSSGHWFQALDLVFLFYLHSYLIRSCVFSPSPPWVSADKQAYERQKYSIFHFPLPSAAEKNKSIGIMMVVVTG